MALVALPEGLKSRTLPVLESSLHYLEAGSGNPILLLHGNPTWSYLWRSVIPRLEGHGRCIAMDCIGMGRSGKPAIAYRFSEHLAYIAAAIEQLELSDITIVGHDWGVALGLALCRLMPQRVRALAFMEGHIHPIASWDAMDPGARALFSQLRSEEAGRRMVIEENIFVETILPSGVRRSLGRAELDAYREPYAEPASRLPLWQWARSGSIAGEPPEMVEVVAANQRYLAISSLPKLLLYAQPGAVIGPAEVTWCIQSCSNLAAVELGPGIHFLPEDYPEAIGEAVAAWMSTTCERPKLP